VRSLAVFLSGLTATIAGAFIRSCSESGLLAEVAQSWCGGSPLQFAAAAHQHCAGCALIVAGVGLIAVSPLLISFSTQSAKAMAQR
jgi:hypothetical protein